MNSLLLMIVATITLGGFIRTQAQVDKPDELMYHAYIGKGDNMEMWKAAVMERKSAYAKAPNDRLSGMRLAVAQFGLLNATQNTHDENLFDDYYNDQIELLKKLIDLDKNWAEPPALLSACYGLKMSYSPMQAMFLGPKSGSLIEKAKVIDPHSAFVMKVYANSKFFTPEAWGGNLKDAIASYERCIQLYESKPDQLKYNWMYLDAVAFLGRAYIRGGNTEKGIVTYEKALKMEPQFDWVKNSLLPKAKIKAQGK